MNIFVRGTTVTVKERRGNFFEDFRLGQVIRHGTPRTVSDGDTAIYLALTGSRYACHSSAPAARDLGFRERPIENLLLFNIAFGKTVPDISFNAVANLGYAEVRFLEAVFAGDTLRCESVIIGLKENSSRKTGVVYVRSTCYKQDDSAVLTWVRWVMVRKATFDARAGEAHVPALAEVITPEKLVAPARIVSAAALAQWCEATACADLWDSYAPGERIHHPSGMTIEAADHMSATRLYQNNAKPHFDALAMRSAPVGARLVYGGHVISVCHALAYDGLENMLGIAAINAGTHVAPTLAGDTLYAYSDVLDKWKLPGRRDVGALRLRLVGLKNTPPSEVPAVAADRNAGAEHHPSVVLDLDYTVLMPRKRQDRSGADSGGSRRQVRVGATARGATVA